MAINTIEKRRTALQKQLPATRDIKPPVIKPDDIVEPDIQQVIPPKIEQPKPEQLSDPGVKPQELIDLGKMDFEMRTKKESPYDIQRERVEAEAQREKERRVEALKRRLAAQGMNTTGMEEKLRRQVEQDIEREKGGRLGEIATTELLAEEQRLAREKEMQFEEKMFGKGLEGQKELLNIKGEQEQDLVNLKGSLEKDFITMKDDLEQGAERRKIRNTRYFDMGSAGQEIPPDELEKLKNEDPGAYDAYMAGKAGKDKAEFQNEQDMKEEYRKSLITALDPDDPVYQEKLKKIYDQLGLLDTLGIEEETGETGTTTPNELTQSIQDKINQFETAGDQAPVFERDELKDILINPENYDVIQKNDMEDWDILTYTTNGPNRWVLTDKAKNWVNDNKGKIYKASNGKLYKIMGTTEANDRNQSSYIIMFDLETGKPIKYSNAGPGKGDSKPFPSEGYDWED